METNKSKQPKTKFRTFSFILFLMMAWIIPQKTFAHCDSYDGPVIQDALKALDEGKVDRVLKWISLDQEKEISNLFQKTINFKKTDKEVYSLLEKHFLETLVRLHREGEGEPYTGLKPAGTTAKIIHMTDTALQENDIDTFLKKLNGHIESVVREKYDTVAKLKKVKDNSVEQGRAYVAAYVDYTHTIEALHKTLEHGVSHGHNEQH